MVTDCYAARVLRTDMETTESLFRRLKQSGKSAKRTKNLVKRVFLQNLLLWVKIISPPLHRIYIFFTNKLKNGK